MIGPSETEISSTVRRGNEWDVYAFPNGMATSIEHFKSMVRRVQTDTTFREGLEEVARARRAALGPNAGEPIWLVAARNPAKYRAVLERLELVQTWASDKLNRRIKAGGLNETAEVIKQERSESEATA